MLGSLTIGSFIQNVTEGSIAKTFYPVCLLLLLVKVLKIVYNRLVDGFRKCGLRKCGLWKCNSFTVAADRIGRAFVAVDIKHF